jgi:transcriptional regulator with XRE-family HTH domain
LVDKKEQFEKLVESSGWSRTELSQRLEVSQASISQYLSGNTEPPAPVLKLFHLLLNEPVPLRDAPTERSEDLEVWKRRAKDAEKKLSDVETGLRRLLAAATSAPLPSSEPEGQGKSLAESGAAKGLAESQEFSRKRRAGAPSGGKR